MSHMAGGFQRMENASQRERGHRLLLGHGADVNVRNVKDETALVEACRDGHIEVVDMLIENGVDVNAWDEDESNALMSSCKNGHVKVVDLLIKRGVDVNVTNMNGWTALMYACGDGYANIVKVLIESGADVNVGEWTAFMIACMYGHVKVVELLIAYSVNISMGDRDGKTALMYACKGGHVKVVELLVERGVDVNVGDTTKRTALMIACLYGHVNIVELLIERGVDVNAVDRDGRAALMFACTCEHIEAVELLLERGVDLNAGDMYSKTALMRACLCGHANIVELLIERGVNVNMVDRDGWTALMCACARGHINVVKLLIECCLDLNVVDKKGRTALMLTCGRCVDVDICESIVDILLQNGALMDIQCEQYGMSAAMEAVENDHPRCLQKLLLSGSNLDLTDKQGHTIFTLAMQSHSSTDCLRLLLAEGNLQIGGNLRPVHKNSIDVCTVLDNLILSIEAGVFEWEWCPLEEIKPASLAALQSGVCPGKIKYTPSMNVSPLIASFFENDTELVEMLIRHLYYFPEDYRTLTTDKDIRQQIPNKDLLDNITRQPMSLQTWCLLTVSESISTNGPSHLRGQRVDVLPVPDRLKRRLKFVLN